MIKVCDAIMGSGKTESAITFMNENPDKKFIYITPFVKEAERILAACPSLNFTVADNKKEHGGAVLRHTHALVESGHNVATTHQAFRLYRQEILDLIREQHYYLIIDEAIDILSKTDVSNDDLRMLEKDGLIEFGEDGFFHKTEAAASYNGKLMDELRLLDRYDLVRSFDDGDDDNGIEQGKTRFFFWSLDAKLLQVFDEVIVLTYMFESQNMYQMLKMKDIPYQKIGISRDEDGTFRFADSMQYVPDYTQHLSEMINILENDQLNAIGRDRYSLSMSWFNTNKAARRREVTQLKNNVYNFYRNYMNGYPASKRMWSTYECSRKKIQGKGYINAFLPFNCKATNAYSSCNCLAYCVNVFMNVEQKQYYHSYGIEVDEDAYALSIMIQWIWRSAIRNGEQIHIYIPSARMRGLLRQWIANVTAESQENTQDETDATAA